MTSRQTSCVYQDLSTDYSTGYCLESIYNNDIMGPCYTGFTSLSFLRHELNGCRPYVNDSATRMLFAIRLRSLDSATRVIRRSITDSATRVIRASITDSATRVIRRTNTLGRNATRVIRRHEARMWGSKDGCELLRLTLLLK